MAKGRNSNFEILRIVAILMITAYHYSIHGATDLSTVNGGGKILLEIISLWGKAGVNIFILIMGYYMIKKGDAGFRKLGSLEIQVLFYSFLGLAAGLSLGMNMGIKTYAHLLFPLITNSYWFITAYFLVYLLSPYINKMILLLTVKEFNRLIIILYIIWCVVPFFTNQKSSGLFWSQFVWFVVMYITGAWLRLNQARFTKRTYYCFFIVCNILLIASALTIEMLSHHFNIPSDAVRYFAWSNSPLIVVICISMMRIAELKESNYYPLVNLIASLVIGMYLFQENVIFSDLCWHQWFDNSLPTSFIMKMVHVFYSVTIVCIIGGTIEYLRSMLFKRILK